jgi:metal-responsive CopG/Arc/MetJ family transcriptional regulator
MIKRQVQFKISKHLLRLIDNKAGFQKRSLWVETAISEMLASGKKWKMLLTASMLMADRATILIRIRTDVLKELDEICEAKGVTRTILLTDACISKIASGEEDEVE